MRLHGHTGHGHGTGHGAGHEAHGLLISNARSYELFANVMFFGQRGRSFRRVVELADVRSGDRVLDVGCGTGFVTRLAARAAAPDGEVIGVDPSPPVLDYARRVTKAANCSYRTGVAQELDLPDESFDLVLTSLAIHHIPEHLRATAFTEMHRVLRPGGRLMVAEFRPPSSGVLRRLVGAVTAPEMEHNPIDEYPPMISSAGFDIAAIGDLPPFLRYIRAGKA